LEVPGSFWYGNALKITAYFEAIRKRPDRAVIRNEWIERAMRSPVREEVQTDGRIRRWVQVPEMKIRYFADTDTLYIEFRDVPVSETRDLDENTVLDLDAHGDIAAITVEHASERAGIPQFSYEQVTAASG